MKTNAMGYGSAAGRAPIPPPKRCRVGVRRSAHASGDRRGRELTPTRLPPTKSRVADTGSSPGQALPLSGGGITEFAAPLRSYAMASP
jgi:hypothetical protein